MNKNALSKSSELKNLLLSMEFEVKADATALTHGPGQPNMKDLGHGSYRRGGGPAMRIQGNSYRLDAEKSYE